MHIIYLATEFVENNGPTSGLPKYLFRVSKALIGLGHRVSVITCSNRSVYYEFYGIHVYRVRRPPIKLYGNQKDDMIASCLRDGYIVKTQLDAIYEKERIDIVQYTSLCGLAYYHHLPIPSVMRMSSYAPMYVNDKNREKKEGEAEIERIAGKRSFAVFAPSIVVAEKFSVDIGKKVDVIESPFVMDDCEEDKRVYQSQFANKKYLMFYGSIDMNKGVCEIADAAYDILLAYPDLYIGIIGDGDKSLVNLVIHNAREYSGRIIYHQAVGFAQLKPVIKNAEAVMLPSHMENLSNACIESMALGQIVIGTRGASFDQLITDGVSGFLCERENAGSLCEAVNRVLMLSKRERKVIIQNAKDRVSLLSPEIAVKQLLSYYRQVINEYSKQEANQSVKESCE